MTQIAQRCGARHDYQVLSEQQRALLTSHSIMDNTDGCGWKTVEIKNITEKLDGTLLDILDVHHFLFHRNGPGGSGDYARARIPKFKRALGVTEDPIKLLGSQTYLFQLDGGASVCVEFDSQKDRV